MSVLERALLFLGVQIASIGAYSVPPNSLAPQISPQLSPQCTDRSTDDCRVARDQNKCFDVFYSQLMDAECPFTCRVERCVEEIGRVLGPAEGSGADDEVNIFDYVTNHAGSGSGSGEKKKKKKKCKNKLLAGHEGDCAAAAAYGNCYRAMWKAIMKRYCAATCPKLCKRKKKKKKKKTT